MADAFLYLSPVNALLISTSIGIVNYALDASGKKVAAIFSLPEVATLTDVSFLYGNRTGTPPTYRVSLQGVGASGNPDGTILGGGSPASATFTPPADGTWDSTVQTVPLDNSYVCTRGQMLAVVVDYSGGTVDASNNSSFNSQLLNTITTRGGLGYGNTYNGSAWQHSTANFEGMAVQSSTVQYGRCVVGSTTRAPGTDGHRAALKFTLPSGWGNTFEVVGMRLLLTIASAATVTLGLWDAAGTALQSVSFDGDHSSAPGSGARIFDIYFSSTTLSTLSFGTTYYLGIQRAGSTPTLYGVDYGIAIGANSNPFGSGNALLSEWNGSAWSDTTTVCPYIIPIIKDWTEPASSGGIPPIIQQVKAVY